MKESELQNLIMNALGQHPRMGWCYITTVGTFNRRGHWMRMGYPGMSDILGQTKDGKLVAIEVKTETGKVSKEQQDFLIRVKGFGGIAGVARSVDDAIAILEDQ